MRKLILFLVSILVIGGGGFVFGYKSCEQVAPPKIGQTDPRIIEKDGKLYFCRSFYEQIRGISFTGSKQDSAGIVRDKQDETASWETYTNSQYGFGIRYPSNWEVKEYPPYIVTLEDKDLGAVKSSLGTLADGTDNPDLRFEYETTSIDNHQSTLQRYYFKNQLRQKNYGLKIGDSDVVIYLMPSQGVSFDIFDQILSTFKFQQ